jgi:hypothetical protein
MKFLIIVNKWANFYFFIQNLSEWHFSNRKEYNVAWEKEVGPFRIEEKSALKDFKQIHLKYPFGKLYLGLDFFSNRHPWMGLTKKLSKNEMKKLKKIFFIWRAKFETLFKRELPLLKQWKREIRKKVNDKSLINLLNVTLSRLYNAPILQRDINIHLLFSISHCTQGMNITNNDIGLSISRYPLENSNHAIGIIWHEIIHSHFEKYYFLPLLRKKFQNNRKIITLIKETVASSLLPNGILGRKFLNQDLGQLNICVLPMSLKDSQLLLELCKQYLRQEKALDEDYIKKVIPFVRKLKNQRNK